jgi:hypothetical protein
MSKRKKEQSKSPANHLAEKIKNAVQGLYYISETDAEILPFVGSKADSVSGKILLAQTKNDSKSIEEREFNNFFSRLTKIQDWFGDEEKETARKFSDLKDLLEKELMNLKVFKVGTIELDIYVVGLDSNSILTGIQTRAVET